MRFLAIKDWIVDKYIKPCFSLKKSKYSSSFHSFKGCGLLCTSYQLRIKELYRVNLPCICMQWWYSAFMNRLVIKLAIAVLIWWDYWGSKHCVFLGGATWRLGVTKILQLVEIPHSSTAYFMWQLSLPSRYPRHNNPPSYASYCLQFPSKPTFTRLYLQPWVSCCALNYLERITGTFETLTS